MLHALVCSSGAHYTSKLIQKESCGISTGITEAKVILSGRGEHREWVKAPGKAKVGLVLYIYVS